MTVMGSAYCMIFQLLNTKFVNKAWGWDVNDKTELNFNTIKETLL